MSNLVRPAAAEALGSALLVAAVVGSGIMAERLTSDPAVALLANSLATGAMLAVLITLLSPVSGAQFNPAVTMVMALRRGIGLSQAIAYVGSQVAGACVGALLAHAMFDLPLVAASATARTGWSQWLAEGVATFGLVLTVVLGARFRVTALPWLVGLYIVAAYWFTASTSFANPAVTIARALTDTFSGIRPIDVPFFIVAQLAGALVGLVTAHWLSASRVTHPSGVGGSERE